VDTSQTFVRFMGLLKTLAEVAPLTTAERDFPERVCIVLERMLEALDAQQGAIFILDEQASRLTCVAEAGMEALPSTITLNPAQGEEWSSLLSPRAVRGTDLADYFGPSERQLKNIRCIAALRVLGKLVGAIAIGKRNGGEDFGALDIEGLELLTSQLALMLHNHALQEALHHQVADNLRLMQALHRSQEDVMDAFAAAIDAKDPHMHGHSQNVARYSAEIATCLGMGEQEVTGIRAAGQLHDIGKVTVDKAVFAKTSALRKEEFREMADHTTTGHSIVRSIKFPWPQVSEIVRWHHERADGTGYPDNLRLDDVPLPVRIVAVADTYDAMTSARPYREPLSQVEALQEIARLTPLKFDPTVVQALLVQARSREAANPEHLPHAPLEVDRISMDLLRRITNQRVYSA
jgi:putative nucleotidyltransferase with HDIG domain